VSDTDTDKTVEGYQVTSADGTLKVTYNGELQKKVYLVLKKSEGTYSVVKPKTSGGVVYYFDTNGIGTKYTKTASVSVTYENKSTTYYVKNGKLRNGWETKNKKKYYYADGKLITGWYKISGKTYYFTKSGSNKGAMYTNRIVGTSKENAYYVDESGVKVTSDEIQNAVNFVNAYTKSGWSRSKKLKTCFDTLWKNYSYQRFYETPTASSFSGYATYMFKNRKGNCYRYAAAFACIAKVLGYETRVAVGQISSVYGGMTPHGWTEVKIDGTWYMCDANMQRNHPKISSYMKTESSYPYRHSCSKRYKLTIKNGKVSWK
jgi:hypothetical protein